MTVSVLVLQNTFLPTLPVATLQGNSYLNYHATLPLIPVVSQKQARVTYFTNDEFYQSQLPSGELRLFQPAIFFQLTKWTPKYISQFFLNLKARITKHFYKMLTSIPVPNRNALNSRCCSISNWMSHDREVSLRASEKPLRSKTIVTYYVFPAFYLLVPRK